LPYELPARREALRIAVDDLAPVVDPAHGAEAERDEQDDPHEAVGEIAPQQRGDDDRYQDQRAAHRRRAGLRKMRLRAVASRTDWPIFIRDSHAIIRGPMRTR
jgi:hypothetical protein